MKAFLVRVLGCVVLCASSGAVLAGNLVCAQNEVTNAYMCFHKDKVRVNGPVRSTAFYKGGPKGVEDTGYTARVHCESKAIELTDRQGVAFARNIPSEKIGRDFVRFLCEHQKVTKDTKLSTK